MTSGRRAADAEREHWMRKALQGILALFRGVEAENNPLHDDQSSHGFYYRNSTRNDTRIVLHTKSVDRGRNGDCPRLPFRESTERLVSRHIEQ